MRGLKTLIGTTALLAGLAMAPAAKAQVVVDLGVQPVCSYGYYGYAPYQCAPMGYYGPGYFYNGIFLGMGPWGGWGYSHGWGSHRFSAEGGGSYHGGPGRVSYHENGGGGGYRAVSHSGGPRPAAGHVAVRRSSTTHSSSQVTESHAAAPHSGGGGGGGGHPGGESHGDHR
jgi:hypothetical protein